MGFVNEYISPEDVEKYGIKALDEYYMKAHYKPSWTRDCERDIYLRYMCRGIEDFADEWTFVLYWYGHQIEAVLKVSGGGNGRGCRNVTIDSCACALQSGNRCPTHSDKTRPRSRPF